MMGLDLYPCTEQFGPLGCLLGSSGSLSGVTHPLPLMPCGPTAGVMPGANEVFEGLNELKRVNFQALRKG